MLVAIVEWQQRFNRATTQWRLPSIMLKRAVLVPIVVLAIAVILLFSARRFWVTADAGLAIQRTDDAYVDADSTPLSTRISGTVRRVDAGDYQSVKRGQLLVELDDE